MYGNASGGMKFVRLTSAGSSPMSEANMSIARSTTWVASGRPAPRSGPVWVVFVTTAVISTSIFGNL